MKRPEIHIVVIVMLKVLIYCFVSMQQRKFWMIMFYFKKSWTGLIQTYKVRVHSHQPWLVHLNQTVSFVEVWIHNWTLMWTKKRPLVLPKILGLTLVWYICKLGIYSTCECQAYKRLLEMQEAEYRAGHSG